MERQEPMLSQAVNVSTQSINGVESVLILKPTLKSILYDLKGDLQTLPHSPTKWEFMAALAEWEQRFFEKYPLLSDIIGTQARLEAAYRLASLYHHLIEPMSQQLPYGEHRVYWQQQLTALRGVIVTLLPEGREPGAFIASYGQMIDERRRLQRLLKRIDEIFQRAEDQLFESFTRADGAFKKKLADFKINCMELFKKELANSQQLHASIDSMNARMHLLFEDFQQSLVESHGYADASLQQRAELRGLLENLHKVIQREK